MRLKNPAGDDLELTMMERALLRAFIDAPQRTLNRNISSKRRANRGTDVTRSLDGIIHRLRRDLAGIIQTGRGEGYVFAVPFKRVY